MNEPEPSTHPNCDPHFKGIRRALDLLETALYSQRDEVALLSGRVELMLRTLGRIVAKIEPSFLDDPFDPEVQRKSKLMSDAVITKLRGEALAQAAHDPEQFDRLRRYFKDAR